VVSLFIIPSTRQQSLSTLNFTSSYVFIAYMNNLRKYADQVKYISDAMKAGQLSPSQGAVQLQCVATLAEQDAAVAEDKDYGARLRKFAGMIHDVIENMKSGRGVIQ